MWDGCLRGMEWFAEQVQDIGGTHTQPIFDPRGRAVYIKDLCEMVGIKAVGI